MEDHENTTGKGDGGDAQRRAGLRERLIRRYEDRWIAHRERHEDWRRRRREDYEERMADGGAPCGRKHRRRRGGTSVTREEVVRTALNLLDEGGLAGLTLRRLAGELGISAPTLYWHVKDKRELLDLMAEQMIADRRASEPPLPKDVEWWEVIGELLRRQYRTLISHRDAPLVMAGNRPTEAMLPGLERLISLWMAAGFPPDEAFETILAINNFVLGSALEFQAEVERARLHRDFAGVARPDMTQFPNFMSAVKGLRRRPRDHHRPFEHGLMLILAGIRARHAGLGAGNGSPDQ